MSGLWWELASPGEVIGASMSPDGSVTVARTSGGELYLGRRNAAAWTWKQVGFPPGGDGGPVREAALLSADATGAVTMAVVDHDGQVWLYESQEAPQPWTRLGAPPAGPVPPTVLLAFAASTASPGGDSRPALVVTDAAGQPWLREGTDPGGTWSPMTLNAGLTVRLLTTAMASVAPGADPQLHVIAAVEAHDTGFMSVRVAVREAAGWTWHDPGSLDPVDRLVMNLSATSIRDASGQLLASVMARVSDFNEDEWTIDLLTGAGSNWGWIGLGRPNSPSRVETSVLAVKGANPQAGSQPVVTSALGDHVWTRSPATSWTDRGTSPADGPVPAGAPAPYTALDQAGTITGQAAVLVDPWSDLYTFKLQASAMTWEHHRCPNGLTVLAGAYLDTPQELNAVRVFAVDEHGALWQRRQQPPAGESQWAYHGTPAAGVQCATAIGLLHKSGMPAGPTWVFVGGSDGHLWARSAETADWAWADHGAPAGRAVVSGTDPVALATPAGGLAVHVLADDGRLWMRTGATAGPGPGPDWTWTDRGVPPGELISSLIGAAPGSPSPVVAVITGLQNVWASVPAGSGFTWVNLGLPPGESIAAGIGLQVPTGAAGAVEIAGLGAPSGQVWTARWTPGAAAPQWTPRGRPPGGPIRGGIGVTPDPAGGTEIRVLGSDQQLWMTSTASTAQDWTRTGPAGGFGRPTTSLTSGRAVTLLDSSTAAAIEIDTSFTIALSPVKRAVLF